MRLDESNKKNEFLRNQFSSQDQKMKSLEQKLAEAVLENRSVFVSVLGSWMFGRRHLYREHRTEKTQVHKHKPKHKTWLDSS